MAWVTSLPVTKQNEALATFVIPPELMKTQKIE